MISAGIGAALASARITHGIVESKSGRQAIKELKGIQWIPGAGQPDVTHWPDVFRRIRKAGKLVQIWGDGDVLDALCQQLGSAAGIVMLGKADVSREDDVRALLKRYHVEEE